MFKAVLRKSLGEEERRGEERGGEEEERRGEERRGEERRVVEPSPQTNICFSSFSLFLPVSGGFELYRKLGGTVRIHPVKFRSKSAVRKRTDEENTVLKPLCLFSGGGAVRPRTRKKLRGSLLPLPPAGRIPH